MYPGHFAAGLALKVAEPRAPTLGLMLGAGFLDLVFGVGVALRVEGGTFSHFIVPWSHSLSMSILWSLLFAAFFWRLGLGVAAAMFAAVMSHWVLDVLSHKPDMPLWPHSAVELGYGPLFGGLGGWLECLVTAAGLLLYATWATRPEHRRRRWGVGVVAATLATTLGAEILVVG